MARAVPIPLLVLSLLCACGSGAATSDTVASPPFDDPSLRGLCEHFDAQFVDGESSPFTTASAAVRAAHAAAAGLVGTELRGREIWFSGVRVGEFVVVARPDDTWDVESGRWCHPG